MIKFFRKIRQNLLTENKFSKYFFYAIGEIVLVVIGILIALSINNWNETQKEKVKLNNVLEIVKLDLIKDTLNISIPIKYYEEKNILLSKIINKKKSKSSLDSITELNYKNYRSTLTAITSREGFNIQNKGINLLKNILINSSFEKDTLISNLIEKHSVFENYFKSDNEVQKRTRKNFEEYSEFSWFLDYINYEYNRDMFEYFYSDIYKRKSAKYNVFTEQYLGDLKAYDRIAKSYIYVIEKRLEKK